MPPDMMTIGLGMFEKGGGGSSSDGEATSTAAGSGATHLPDLCDELKLNSELTVTPTTKVKRATTRRRAMQRILFLLPNVERAGSASLKSLGKERRPVKHLLTCRERGRLGVRSFRRA